MKALYRITLVVMLLFLLMGAGIFMQGVHDHFHAPRVSLTSPGVSAAAGAPFTRAAVKTPYVFA